MSNCITAKPYTALRNLRDRVRDLEAGSAKSEDLNDLIERVEELEENGGGGGSSGTTSHNVTTSSFLKSGAITAESVNGILKVGGYFQTKNQHPGDGVTTSTICTIANATMAGMSSGVIIDHGSSSPKPYNILLLTENGQTRVQIESCAYALAASTWINFTIYGILEV